MKYQQLVGCHAFDIPVIDPKTQKQAVDGQGVPMSEQYMVRAGEYIETDIDLEKRFNKEGYPPKFVRIFDGADVNAMPEDAFAAEAARRGYVPAPMAHTQPLAPKGAVSDKQGLPTPPPAQPVAHRQPPATVVQPKTEVNLDSMTEGQLRRYAEEIEVDVTGVKGKENVIAALRKVQKVA